MAIDYSTAAPAPRCRLSARSILLIIVGVLAACALGPYLLISSITLGTDTEKLTNQQMQSIGKFTFPPGATNIRGHLQSWQDFYLRVRFTLPGNQLGTFLQGTEIATPLSSSKVPYQFAGGNPGEPPWWTPGKPSRFETGDNTITPTGAATQPFIVQYVLVDETNPNLFTVWLVVHDR